jgi:enoyl-CoA hydratase/carnithine racemase
MRFEQYRESCRCAVLTRDDDGVLTIRLHRQGGPLMWGGVAHAELPELFAAMASDRDNRVVILTGTGDTFIGMTGTHFGPDLIDPEGWDRILFEGLRLVNQLLDIEVPMIAAVNGPAVAHSELAVLCDVVLCSENAYFEDAAHIPGGLLPGDSMQIIWPMLIGHNRGRTFLLTGQRIPARQALDWGAVAEVLPPEELLPRARQIAASIAVYHPTLLRGTRHAFTRPLKRAMLDDLHVGLSLEALAALAGREQARAADPSRQP